jgi:squalene-hopene/tetraprenyl-beta-curcumene cyclase
LCSLKPRARNPRGVDIRELFTTPPEEERDYFPIRSPLNRVFLALDKAGRLCEPLIPRFVRSRALRKAEAWFVERLNGSGGLGAIFPAMVNAYEALDCLGYPRNHPHMVSARKALADLLVERDESAYCQPCLSPVWDTGLAAMALQEEGSVEAEEAAERGLDWLQAHQLRDQPGDWRRDRPDLPGGGWPFQFCNSHYPDLDDTAVVAWAMDQAHTDRYWDTVERAANWLRGMQSRNGGFAAYDADNTYYYLNEIPFADHGALLDPPTSDVTARCAALFARRDGPYKGALEASVA